MTRLPRISVHGNPAPQGSVVCKARHISYDGTRPGHQNLQPDNEKVLKQWRKAVAKGGRALLTHLQQDSPLPVQPFSGAVLIIATHTIARPRTVPLSARAWPSTKSPGHGDVDKLARALLDGLADAGVYTNDAQVCGLHVWKRYPDTPTCEWIDPRDHLTKPGVIWRLHQLEQPPDELPFDAGSAGSTPGEGPASAPEDAPASAPAEPARPCPNISNGQFCRYYDGHLNRGVPHTYGGGLKDPVTARHCEITKKHEPHAWNLRGDEWCSCGGEEFMTPAESLEFEAEHGISPDEQRARYAERHCVEELRYEQLADEERIG